MTTFLVATKDANEALGKELTRHFPGGVRRIADNQWLVSAKSNTQAFAESIRTKAESGESVIVVTAGNYAGRHDLDTRGVDRAEAVGGSRWLNGRPAVEGRDVPGTLTACHTRPWAERGRIIVLPLQAIMEVRKSVEYTARARIWKYRFRAAWTNCATIPITKVASGCSSTSIQALWTPERSVSTCPSRHMPYSRSMPIRVGPRR